MHPYRRDRYVWGPEAEHNGALGLPQGSVVTLAHQPRVAIGLQRPDANAVRVYNAMHVSVGMLEAVGAALVVSMLADVNARLAVTYSPPTGGRGRVNAATVNVTPSLYA